MSPELKKALPGETTTYAYDPANRLLTAANNAGMITNAYDPLGRLKQVTFPGAKIVAYGYDPASNRTSLAYPGGAPAITYAYDELNRLKSMTDLNTQSITYAYDALSRRGSLALPNGVISTYGYDAINELLTLTHKKNTTTLSGVSYSYDELGNRKTQTTQPANTARSYTYDALSQLRTATNPAVAYAYDAVGNRTTAAGTTYTANTLNQYTQVGAVVPTYDPNGNVTGDGTATDTFNPENRLTQVVKGGITTTFTYDALGRRASKTVGAVTTKFLYDGADLLAETNTAGTITGLYLHGPGIDEPLELKRGSTTSYYSADGLGSIAHLTDSTGTIVEQYSYDLFGQPTIKNGAGTTLTTSALGNPFLFTGREWDSETGLYYYRARYYHSTLGRFLSRDPLGYLPDQNLYRYVRNNALNWLDPAGQNPLAIAAVVGAVTAVLVTYAASKGNYSWGQAAAAVGVGATVGIGAAAAGAVIVASAAAIGMSTAGTITASGVAAGGFSTLGSVAYQSLTGTNAMDLNLTAGALSFTIASAAGGLGAYMTVQGAANVGANVFTVSKGLATSGAVSTPWGMLAGVVAGEMRVTPRDILNWLQTFTEWLPKSSRQVGRPEDPKKAVSPDHGS